MLRHNIQYILPLWKKKKKKKQWQETIIIYRPKGTGMKSEMCLSNRPSFYLQCSGSAVVVHPDGMPHHDSSYSMFDVCCNAGLKNKIKKKKEKQKKR